MDPFTSPEPAASSGRRQLRATVAVAALIVVMVLVSIAGSAFWRPAPVDRVTLELGGKAANIIFAILFVLAVAGIVKLVMSSAGV